MGRAICVMLFVGSNSAWDSEFTVGLSSVDKHLILKPTKIEIFLISKQSDHNLKRRLTMPPSNLGITGTAAIMPRLTKDKKMKCFSRSRT